MSHSRIRIAHCLQQVRSGGVERRRLSLARNLDPNRFEQIIICTEASPSLRDEFERSGCQVTEIGPMRRGFNWPKVQQTARLLREFRPHIVHGAVFEGVIIAVLAGRLARVPIIVTEEITNPSSRRLSGHVYFRLLTGLSDHVIAVGQGVSDYLTEDIRLPRSKVRLIYNGVSEPTAAAPEELTAVRELLQLSEDTLILGTVGRLAAPSGQPPDSNKRVSDAIMAMKHIAEPFPTARLVVVGDGPDREYLERFACSQGLAERVLFAGFQSRTRPFFETMNVLIHPSEAEGLPLVPIEAMFASRPVVATDVPGTNEVVAGGKSGFLVSVGRPAELAQQAIKLLGDARLRQLMGAAGQERARSLFGEARYVAELGAFYEELAGACAMSGQQ